MHEWIAGWASLRLREANPPPVNLSIPFAKCLKHQLCFSYRRHCCNGLRTRWTWPISWWWSSRTWSCLSGKLASGWPASDVQWTGASPTWRSGGNPSARSPFWASWRWHRRITCVCLCRFTAVAESLLRVQETLQKLQDQNRKFDKKDSLGFTGRLVEMEKFTLFLWKKLISKWVVELYYVVHMGVGGEVKDLLSQNEKSFAWVIVSLQSSSGGETTHTI